MTPPDERLVAARRALAAGDHARVRSLAAELRRSEDPDLQRAAAELEVGVAVDPVQVGAIVACVVLFFVIAYIYVLA